MGKYVDNLISKLELDKEVIIQTHNYPDPDAIATAFALKYILEYKGIQCKICYFGFNERHTIVKLIESLHIEMWNLNDSELINKNSNIILVDTQRNNSNTRDILGDEVACIDHHPDSGEDYLYKDIRPEVGACSSIITEYLIDGDIPITEEVATALVYGMKMDTLDFSRGVSKFDLEMYAHLLGLENKKIIEDMCKDKYMLEDMKIFAAALSSLRCIEDIGFIRVGDNCPEPLMASIADFALSVVEINFVVCYTEKGDSYKFSIRSQLENLEAGKIISAAFKGIGNGGGHKEMAGGVIPKCNIIGINKLFDDFIEDKFIDAIKSVN